MNTLPLATDHKNYITIHEIAIEMSKAGLPPIFIDRAVKLAKDFEGAFELLLLWRDETDKDTKDSILADIEEEIEGMRTHEGEHNNRPLHRPKINFDDIEGIAKNVIAFKKRLRALVDSNMGVAALAKTIDMPAPSLYRFFSSASMPRKTTLYKIANALNLEEKDIAFEYTR